VSGGRRRLRLVPALRDARAIEGLLAPVNFAMPVGRIAMATKIPERRLRRLLPAMEQAGILGSTRDTFAESDQVGRPPRRYFARVDPRTLRAGTPSDDGGAA
jgi:hypothetical protein